ncbi:hypothetical protein AGMMS49965_18660 [Bacteroidia bacterium]|nr:hypothetical protein AGMMS49965_18660 [Bacteroidia bacterium]
MSVVSSCGDDDEPTGGGGLGTISGTVTNDAAIPEPIADVTVTVSGVDGTVKTGADGKYTVSNVSLETHTVTFSKTGWQTVSSTIAASKFDATTKVATVNATLVNAEAKIVGTVYDAKNGDVPLAGVVVAVAGVTETVTTAADGKFAFENLVEDDYTVTFTFPATTGYAAITKGVSKTGFTAKVATVDIHVGVDVLPGLSADDLRDADKWYYNEYRGGGNADEYPHWDWACDYMASLKFQGAWQEQWEGTALQIRNAEADQANPANLNVFDSYTYGSKLITADNKILSLRLRTHGGAEAPAIFGVQVVDLSAAEPAAVKVGENQTYASDDYTDFHFDLSAYVGKEVVIAIGIYRESTGDYWRQLVLRAIRFAGQNVVNWDWLPGTDVVAGWKLTQETVRSTMPQTLKSFTGVSPLGAGRDTDMETGYPAAYQSWRDVHHIGHEWSFVPLKKDPEVTPSEGYIIKTRGGGTLPDFSVPEAYIYAKFAIAAGNNSLTLKARTFGDNFTFFKLTAIENNGTVTHLTPASNTAVEASAVEDGEGCWKFKNNDGGKDVPDGYASFVYDLASFNGKDVVLVFGVYKGEDNGDESKLCFYSIDLN